jgi:hypothetical protein
VWVTTAVTQNGLVEARRAWLEPDILPIIWLL